MKNFRNYLLIFISLLLNSNSMFGQNPIISDQFTADPSARVYDGKVYVYPSHDIPGVQGRGRADWFCMEDYHVFSSENLTDWFDHGVIVSQDKVPWVNPNGFNMWAPDCISANGKYYFYFPAGAKDTIFGKGFSVGVAVSENPYGPFTPESEPIKGVHGIDPNAFIDRDGQAYLYWAAGNIFAAKMKGNMLELASEPIVLKELPVTGLKEGPFMFERNGVYYLTYPHVQNKTECLEYAIGDNPLGPFKVIGVIMDESPECWTNHQSIIQFKNQWYLFYHHNDLSPQFDKNRSIRIDSLLFNEDGTIQKVKPTLRGVGVTNASQKIQIDRYSQISSKGVSVAFIDTLNKFSGWKAILDTENAWIKYDNVDFENKICNAIYIRVVSAKGSNLQIKLIDANGPIIAQVVVPANKEWSTIRVDTHSIKNNIQNLVLLLAGKNPVEVDWISFK